MIKSEVLTFKASKSQKKRIKKLLSEIRKINRHEQSENLILSLEYYQDKLGVEK